MTWSLKKAVKKQSKLRMSLQGASGSGKTYSALSIATNLAKLDEGEGRVALIDTERGSAKKYADIFDFDLEEWEGDFSPPKLIEMLAHVPNGYSVIVIDSVTHFWNGTGGFLEMVDDEVRRMSARGGRGDSHAAWKAINKVYNKFVEAILRAPCHVLMTMRAKTEYERANENGKTKIRKLGMAPEMRDAFQYEPDIEGMLDDEHNFVIGKTRCHLVDGKVYHKPGADFAKVLHSWLTDGAPAPELVQQPKPEPQPQIFTVSAAPGQAAEWIQQLESVQTLELYSTLAKEAASVFPRTHPDRAQIVEACKAAKARLEAAV